MDQGSESELIRAIGRLEGKLDGILVNVSDLKGAFDTMEKGRLSRLEVAFATLETTVSVKAKNTALIIGLVCSVATSVVAAVILRAILG